MITTEKDKIVALCEKWGLKELNFTKGVYIAEDNSGITVNLRGDNPVVGVTIAGQLHTEGHGNLKVEDYQQEVEAIMKSSSKKSLSFKHSTDTSKHLVDTKVATLQASGGVSLQSSQNDNIAPPAKLQKAKCKECGIEFELTLDEAQKIFEKYDGIYCMKCRPKEVKAKHEEKEVKNEKKEGDNKAMETKITVCGSCGLELSAPRALECYSGKKSFQCAECDEKAKAKTKGDKNMDEKLPANKQEAKLPVKKTDAQIDEMIELAKAEKFLKGQGGSYTVSGKNRPDSAMVQKIANAENISCEILFAEQTKDYAHVVVRGHQGNNYVDAVVHHDFETEFQLQTMEIIKKNSQILDHYEGLIPVLKEGAFIVISDKQVDAKYHLIHTLLSFKTFSLRDATTKAMQIVQSKLLNQDPRTKEEVASEQKERDLVEEKRNQKR